MQTSSNGGQTWGPARNSGDNATGLAANRWCGPTAPSWSR